MAGDRCRGPGRVGGLSWRDPYRVAPGASGAPPHVKLPQVHHIVDVVRLVCNFARNASMTRRIRPTLFALGTASTLFSLLMIGLFLLIYTVLARRTR